MSDAELIARLRDAVSGEHDMTPHGADVLQAAARSIEKNYYLPNIAGEWRKVAAEIKGESHA